MSILIELKRRIGKVLLTWSIASFSVGIVLIFISPGTIYGGIGLQAIIWGFIDAFIAYYILVIQREESIEKIAKTVFRSIGIDIVYQVAGIIVIVTFFQDPYMVGNGVGVIIQGFFLLLLDSFYYNALKKLEI